MRATTAFLFVLLGTFIIDQNLKQLFIAGFYHAGSCIDFELHYNNGVAFSMFAFLGDALKWIQVALVLGLAVFFAKEGYLKRYAFPSGLLFGGALGNLYDRFNHGAVVDYVAWHCGFDFAVFNFADVAIDIGVAWLLVMLYFFSKEEKKV